MDFHVRLLLVAVQLPPFGNSRQRLTLPQTRDGSQRSRCFTPDPGDKKIFVAKLLGLVLRQVRGIDGVLRYRNVATIEQSGAGSPHLPVRPGHAEINQTID
jgi:hypothetical protein